MSALRTVLKDDKLDIEDNQFLISSLTKACRLINDKVHTRLPIHKGVLTLLLKDIAQYYLKQPYLAAMYQALYCTGYYGLFRIGELTDSPHAVLAKDVHINVNKQKLLFILHTSKTHWKDTKPQLIKISKYKRQSLLVGGNKALKSPCPYKLLRNYLQFRGPSCSQQEKFFIFCGWYCCNAITCQKLFT